MNGNRDCISKSAVKAARSVASTGRGQLCVRNRRRHQRWVVTRSVASTGLGLTSLARARVVFLGVLRDIGGICIAFAVLEVLCSASSVARMLSEGTGSSSLNNAVGGINATRHYAKVGILLPEPYLAQCSCSRSRAEGRMLASALCVGWVGGLVF